VSLFGGVFRVGQEEGCGGEQGGERGEVKVLRTYLHAECRIPFMSKHTWSNWLLDPSCTLIMLSGN
jgi:hypothetical protein